jgi:outer membrane protein OmpA-like peptidoglycan-associated protein
MLRGAKKLNFALAGAIIAVALATPALAGQLTSDQIVKALTVTKRVTRQLSDVAGAEDRRFIDSLRKRTTRSLTLDDRDKVAAIAEQKPSIDLEIKFDFNSDAIGNAAMPAVTALGQALSNPAIKGGTFVLAGYTDAKGSDGYNQDLSNRRADSVKKFLVEKYKIDASTLITVGFGKTHLRNASDPYGAENRRVQIVNVTN